MNVVFARGTLVATSTVSYHAAVKSGPEDAEAAAAERDAHRADGCGDAMAPHVGTTDTHSHQTNKL